MASGQKPHTAMASMASCQHAARADALDTNPDMWHSRQQDYCHQLRESERSEVGHRAQYQSSKACRLCLWKSPRCGVLQASLQRLGSGSPETSYCLVDLRPSHQHFQCKAICTVRVSKLFFQNCAQPHEDSLHVLLHMNLYLLMRQV